MAYGVADVAVVVAAPAPVARVHRRNKCPEKFPPLPKLMMRRKRPKPAKKPPHRPAKRKRTSRNPIPPAVFAPRTPKFLKNLPRTQPQPRKAITPNPTTLSLLPNR